MKAACRPDIFYFYERLQKNKKSCKKVLTFFGIMYIISKSSEIRVWRSLVARLTGGQEAAGSSPVTRTSREPRHANA